MSTYNVPENTRSELPPTPGVFWRRPYLGGRLPDSAIRSARFTSPVLCGLGALSAWSGQTAGAYGAVSTGLCVCVCAAGLFGEDLLQRSYRRDRAVLAHVAAHPGSATRYVARAIRAPECVVARNLDRLTDEGLLVIATDGATPALRSYRLAS